MSDSTFEHHVTRWWPDADARRHNGSLRAERAELRRCPDATSVIFCSGYQRLRRSIAASGLDIRLDTFELRLAVIAAVLAHVDENSRPSGWRSGDFAEELARPAQDRDTARMSGLRFRRLLLAEEHDDLLTQMVRAVRLAGRRAPVASLARDLRWWGEEHDRVRRTWANRYYETAPSED